MQMAASFARMSSLMKRSTEWAKPINGQAHRAVLPFDADLLLNVIEQVFEIEKKNFFGSGKNKRIVTAKEVIHLDRQRIRCDNHRAVRDRRPRPFKRRPPIRRRETEMQDRSRIRKHKEESSGEVRTENHTIACLTPNLPNQNGERVPSESTFYFFDARGNRRENVNLATGEAKPIVETVDTDNEGVDEPENRSVTVETRGVKKDIDYEIQSVGNTAQVVQGSYDNEIVIPRVPKFIDVPVSKNKPDPIVESMSPKQKGLIFPGY
jgi:hypothetical protein